MITKTAFILSGVSGCGKSTVALTIAGGDKRLVCEANHYMLNEDGNYEFDANKLDHCHQLCFMKFQSLCDKDEPIVVQSNTNLVPREYDRYMRYAKSKGYVVHLLLVAKPEEYVNHRDIPQEVVNFQSRAFGRLVHNNGHHRRKA